MTNGPSLAIDFGTTNTTAVLIHNKQLERVKFGNDWRLSSAVQWASTGPLVGNSALAARRSDPSSFVRCPKRLLGTEPAVLGGESVTPVELAAVVLAEVRREVERQIGRMPSTVIVTRPVQWGRTRRELFAEAVRAAELHNVSFIEEPVAAAVCIGNLSGIAEERPFCVVDFGGGTLDVAVVVRKAGRFDVLAARGDEQLGGEDVDDLLYEHALGRMPDSPEGRLLKGSQDPAWIHRRTLLRDNCRLAKEQLAGFDLGNIDVLSTYEVVVTRQEFDGLTSRLVDRVLATVRETVDGIGLNSAAVPLYLVGGSSRLAGLEQRLRTGLGCSVMMIGDPQFVVAEGAAMAVEKPTWVGELIYQQAAEYANRYLERIGATPYLNQVGAKVTEVTGKPPPSPAMVAVAVIAAILLLIIIVMALA